ncbi:hypothetical protein sos41_10120 [Alphaproteobacteria bacterium SO-S41]|nr:hypothetical protein sos41_10120 [Alphaproteobacteria bacterium SO-S41]
MSIARGVMQAAWLAASILLASTATAKPPVEAFAALPAMRSPSLSPDGLHFAAIQEMGGRPIAAIYAVGGSAPPVGLPSDDWVIWGVQWVSNDRLLLMAGKGAQVPGARELWTLNRSVAVSVDGSGITPLLDNITGLGNNSSSASISDLALDDPQHIYMPLFYMAGAAGPSLDIFKVNVMTGEGERFVYGSESTADWIMDGHGHVAGRIDETRGPLGQRLMVPDGGSWRELVRAPYTSEGALSIAGLSADGGAVVRLGEAGGRIVLTRLELASGKESVLYAHPAFDIAGTIHDEWTGRVIGAQIGGEGGTIFFDSARQQMHEKIRRAFPGLLAQEVSLDLTGRKIIAVTEGPRHPPTYHYVDMDTKEATEIVSSYPGLTEADLGEMKPYDYVARDGLKIPAFITLPPGKAPKNLPAVVMPHGGPDARDAWGFDWWAQFLANRGYVVLQPNFRGSSGYGRAFTEAGLQQWGLKMQDDISDGVAKLIADGIVDPTRICIVGASYGGYAALAGATLTPDLYACAASVAGVSDLPKMIKHERKKYGRDSAAVSFWISRIGSPIDDSERLRATSPARQAANVKCPILLLHGELDTTVPIEQSEFMQDALQDAGKPVTFIKLVGDDHYLQLGSTRLQMLTALEAFLAANIGS